MKRYESQTRPTAGCLSVPLFNQKKRSRLPMTSNPTENEFSSSHEYMSTQSPASSSSTTNTGYQDQAPRCPAPSAETSQWNRQANPQSRQLSLYPSSRPAPATVGRGYTCLPHPYKPGNTSSQTGQHNMTARQDSRGSTNLRQSSSATPCSIGNNNQSQPVPSSRYSQSGQQAAYRPASTAVAPQSQQTRAPPPSRPSPAPQQQSNTWKFKTTSCPGPPRPPVDNQHHTQAASRAQTIPAFKVKPATENSLRILTAVISGMRHWSQFKDKAPYLFEIFATLDSAVTVGSHGAKDFLMRDGKEVMQCVFYENELQLPRLVRGQVHRCVGNYDSRRDLLTCVSVRAALPSEQRNSQKAVKASDTEMSEVVKSLSEV